jgi:SAM-dependent methyltransferase
VRQYNGLTLPFERDTFDLVYCFGVLHHVKYVDELLDNIWSVTKQGGEINAMLYNTDSLLFAYSILHQHIFCSSNVDRLLSEANVLSKISKYSERNEGCPYTRTYTVLEAEKLFEQWYSNVTVEARYNVIDIGTERKVKLNLDDKYGLGWHLIVKGTK